MHKTRIAALVGGCLAAMTAAAGAQSNDFDLSSTPAPAQTAKPQSNSLTEITFGISGVTQGSAAYGRYNGMPQAGAGFLGGFNIQRRDPWDSGTTQFLSVTGTNLDFGYGHIGPEASVSLKYGQQGSWSVFANYDAMTYFANDNFLSILDKNGHLSPDYNALLTANGLYFSGVTTPPPSTAKFGAFNGSTHVAASSPVTTYGPGTQLSSKIETRRDKGTVGADADLGDWVLSAVYSHEHKQGSLEQAMTTGGNNAGMVTFPMPIDYDTDSFVAMAAYTTPDFQAKISYVLSSFTDNNSGGYAYQGWNFAAYKNVAVTPNTYTSYAKSGVYSLPPSNMAHTVKAELAYNFDPTTRLYGTFVYGVQLQNDPFVAATTIGYIPAWNPTMAAQLASNPSSLDGFVQTFFGNATLTSRPLAGLDIKLAYTIDIRDPHTNPMWIYGDPTDNTALKHREAVPVSWTKQQVEATAAYHITSSTRVTAGFAYHDDQRANAITHRAKETEESLRVDSTFSPFTTGWIKYEHSNRSASAPDWSLWLVQIPSDCGNTLAQLGCQQVPFYEAARTHDGLSGMLISSLDADATFSIYAKWNGDRYHLPPAVYNGTTNPSVGINKSDDLQIGPDLDYRLSQDTELHAYYTFLHSGRNMRALNDQDAPTTPGLWYYSVGTTYDIHTVGLGGTWRANDQLKLGADYSFSYGGERFVQSGSWDTGEAGQTYGGDPLLNTGSGAHHVKLSATYDYSQATSYYLSYQFDSLSSEDWALIGPTVGQVLTGNIPPRYNVSTIMAAMTLRL